MNLSRLVLASPLGRFILMGMTIVSLTQPHLWSIGGSIAVASPPQKVKSFAQWCQQKNSVPTEIRHTLDILLKQAGTNNCQQADAKLRNLISLRLDSNKIVDVRPLAGLTKLTELYLDNNKIVDVKPLAGLTRLTGLYLNENKIVDVRSLAGLTHLTGLILNDNPIAVKTCPVKPASICEF